MIKKSILKAVIIALALSIVITLIRVFVLMPITAKNYVNFLVDNDVRLAYARNKASGEDNDWSTLEYLVQDYPNLNFHKTFEITHSEFPPDGFFSGVVTEVDFSNEKFNLIHGTYPASDDEIVLTIPQAAAIAQRANSRMREYIRLGFALNENTTKLSNLQNVEDLVGTQPFIKGIPPTSNVIELYSNEKVVGIVDEPSLNNSILVSSGYFDKQVNLATLSTSGEYCYAVSPDKSTSFYNFVHKEYTHNRNIYLGYKEHYRYIAGFGTFEFRISDNAPDTNQKFYYWIYIIPILFVGGYLHRVYIYNNKKRRQLIYDKYVGKPLPYAGEPIAEPSWDGKEEI